ncbi:MAG: Gfo/Idh/MocA family oxidoreductase [Phycisphaerae bacterium]|jgi:predicted dehydrogenase
MKNKKRLKVAVIGAGARGMYSYGEFFRQHPEKAEVVAIAEPRDYFRNEMVRRHNIRSENVFTDWKQLLDAPKMADIIIIASTDRQHTAPAICAAEKGYHILLEKPIAPTASECIKIINTVQKKGVIFAVCHVLRYAPFFKAIKNIIDSGKIGDLCSIQHMEGVGWWHFPHSFVRGNFGNEKTSSFILLAKCCHDIDLLRWWVDKPCVKVSSFGHLKHFKKENRPADSADRCIDCVLADNKCPYSAKKFYFERLRQGRYQWPLDMVITEMTEEALCKSLKNGPYGRCAYLCDNDVMDTQIVNMDFENNVLVGMIVSAFTPIGRRVRVMGTKGYLEGDEETIRTLDFLSGQWSEIQANTLAVDITGGHGGGDIGLMNTFLDAVRNNNPSLITTGPEDSLESHLIVLAAEKARLENRVVPLTEIYSSNGLVTFNK